MSALLPDRAWPGTTPGAGENHAPESDDPGLARSLTASDHHTPMAPTRPSGALPVHDHQLDLILGAIAVAARSLTEASGSAIAMWRDDMMVCRARSGEMSPPLGARLSAESGISGECRLLVSLVLQAM